MTIKKDQNAEVMGKILSKIMLGVGTVSIRSMRDVYVVRFTKKED